MSSWSNADNAGSSPLWALMQLNTEQTSGNQTDLFEDNTADNFITERRVESSSNELFKYCIHY